MMKTEKEIFIGEVRRHLSEAGEVKHKRRWRSKTLYGIPCSWLVLILSAFIGTGALVSLIWTTYNLQVTGDIDVNGNVEEPISLYYDGTMLTGTSMIITAMDFAELDPGDDFTVTHEFESTDGITFDVDVDTSSLPDNSDPASLWYGFDVWILQHGTQTNLTAFTIQPLETYEFDIRYRVHPLFEEPLIPYPFNVGYDIEVSYPPEAVNDEVTKGNQAPLDVDVIANDISHNGALTVTNVVFVSGNNHMSAAVVDNKVQVTTDGSWSGPYTLFQYTIADGIGKTDTGLLNVTYG